MISACGSILNGVNFVCVY